MTDQHTRELKYDAGGYRRIRPSERHAGMVELRLPNGRCIQAAGFGAAAEAAVVAKAREAAA